MSPPNLKALKVLYVEDEVLIAFDGEAIMRDMGFEEITMAFSLHDAREATERSPFDLAVLDINLGGGDTSLGLADALLARGTRVLFTSGYNSSEGMTAHLKAPLVQKPFDAGTLETAIGAALEARTEPRA